MLRLAADAALDILDPSDDLHATAGYRKHVTGVLLRRAVAAAYGNATGPQPHGRSRAAKSGVPWRLTATG
jgi:hypothetical protein